MIFLIINIVFLVILVAGAYWMWRQTNVQHDGSGELPELDSYTLLSISIPKLSAGKPEGAEQFFAAMHGIFRSGVSEQPRVSLEIVAKSHAISFRAYVPTDLKDFVVSQIFAQYPAVEIKELSGEEDYAAVDENLKVVATELTLKKPTAFPIKTFQNFEVDPLSTTTGVLSSLNTDEEVWIQMIIRPVDDDWQDLGRTEVKNLKEPAKKPKGFFEIIMSETKEIFFQFFKAIIAPAPSEKKEEKKKDEKKDDLGGPEQQAVKAIEEKITKLAFETNVRILSAAPDEHMARARLEQIVGAYKQFNTINLNSFVVKDFINDRGVLDLFKSRSFGQSDMIFNITELATLYHLPSETVSTPRIVWAGSKKGEPPANLPVVGSVPADELTLLGETNFRNQVTKFGIKRKDRRLHTYVIGKTGTGKSTLLENMIYDDIKEGRGVAVVDPHGQLIEHVLKFIPEDRINDVIYFNPSDHDWPIGFNPLENKDLTPEKKVILSSGVVGVFKKIFGESWGPRLEYILRNAILGLLDYPHATLLGVMRVLSDNAFRRLVISEIKDPTIKAFFVDEYEKYDPKFRQEAINPIQNKVGQFLSSSIIRNIVGQPSSTINLEEIMNNGKILLADLSIGRIGEDNSALLGSMLITQIQLSAMGRTNIAEDQRRDFYLYVDEFQNFATDSFATILSEARKYRLSLIMAHQYIAQMPETVSNAVFGNIGTMISFRVGAGDADALKHEFEPIFESNDLVNLDNYQIYLKMAIDGVTVPAFSASTLIPPTEVYENSLKVIESSRKQFSKPRNEVEDYIAEWSSPIDLNSETRPGEKGSSLKAPGNETPADKGFSLPAALKTTEVTEKSEVGETAVKTEEPPKSLPTGHKIEILKDRFARNWYAVTGEHDHTKNSGDSPKNEPVQQVERPAGGSTNMEQVEHLVSGAPLHEVQITEPVHEGVVAEETGDILKEEIAKERQEEPAIVKSDGEEQPVKASTPSEQGSDSQIGNNDHLITWDQVEELGLVKPGETRNQTGSNDILPIDEL